MKSAVPVSTGEQAVTEDQIASTESAGGGDDSQRVLSNSLIVMLRQGLQWFLNFLLLLFMPTYLGAEGMGQVQFTVSFIAVVLVLTTFGYRQYITKEVARDNSNAALFLGPALGLRLLLTILTVIVVVAIVESVGYDSDLKTSLYLGNFAFFFLGFARLLVHFLWGFEDMKGPATAEVAAKVVAVALALPVLSQGATG